MLPFFSIISGINARDSNVFPNSAEAPTTYFSSSEVDSFTFMDQKGNPALALYSDYFTVRNSYNLEKFPYRHVLKEANINYIEEGYVILRVEELQEKDGLSFSHSGDTFQLYRYKIDSLNSENDIQTSLNNKDNIYSNGKVRLFLIINDGIPWHKATIHLNLSGQPVVEGLLPIKGEATIYRRRQR